MIRKTDTDSFLQSLLIVLVVVVVGVFTTRQIERIIIVQRETLNQQHNESVEPKESHLTTGELSTTENE